VASVVKGLRLDAPLADPNRIAAACKHFTGHGALAARDIIGRHLKAHKMI
jgi:beta-glucosidase-like glycosyl hydrolase